MDDTFKKKFVCNRCGCCCKNIKYYEPAQFLDRGDGVCKYYNDADKACTIYDFRPDFCRVDKMYKLYLLWYKNNFIPATTNFYHVFNL